MDLDLSLLIPTSQPCWCSGIWEPYRGSPYSARCVVFSVEMADNSVFRELSSRCFQLIFLFPIFLFVSPSVGIQEKATRLEYACIL